MTKDSMRAGKPRLDQLSTLQLPTLPAGTSFLLKSLTNEDIDFIELASIIEKFPSIAGKLISLVNSAWSAPASAITSLEDTCSRLGFAGTSGWGDEALSGNQLSRFSKRNCDYHRPGC
ncbi:MAG: HDOD domain-containing protein [Gammaproteobacteria bacterium]|nr:HDOD domain-containing protein [Gammaproteobacteria bacterium]